VADQPSKPAKRLVRNPETFREKVVKAADESEKPKRTAKLRQFGSKVVTPIVRPIRSGAGKLGKKKPVKVAAKPARFVGKIVFPVYLRRSWQELKLVTWPNWKQSRSLTFAVLIFAVIFGVTIAIVDYGLDKLFKDVLLK
jgi:preprotein translocase SecE subunit